MRSGRLVFWLYFASWVTYLLAVVQGETMSIGPFWPDLSALMVFYFEHVFDYKKIDFEFNFV